MKMLTTLILTAAVALSSMTAGSTEKTYTRAEFKQACITQAPDGMQDRAVKAICECATQYISAMKHENNRYANWTITANDPLVGESVPVCFQVAERIGPQKFFELFELTQAGASGS